MQFYILLYMLSPDQLELYSPEINVVEFGSLNWIWIFLTLTCYSLYVTFPVSGYDEDDISEL